MEHPLVRWYKGEHVADGGFNLFKTEVIEFEHALNVYFESDPIYKKKAYQRLFAAHASVMKYEPYYNRDVAAVRYIKLRCDLLFKDAHDDYYANSYWEGRLRRITEEDDRGAIEGMLWRLRVR